MIIVTARIRVKKDAREKAIRLAREFAASSRREPGCIDYRFYADLADPNTFFLFEQWESFEALQAHFESPNMDRFNTRLPALLDGEVVVERFEATPVEE